MKKQHLATLTILEIAHALLKPGRPRKRPGKARPEAITPWDSTVSYRDGNAIRYSLTGAINRAAYSIRLEVSKATLSRARADAGLAVTKALGYSNHVNWTDLIDTHENDTREIQRGLKRAIKQLEKTAA